MQYGGYGGTVHWVRYGGVTVRYRYRGYDGYSTVHRITTVPTRTFKIAYSKQIACYSQQAGKLPAIWQAIFGVRCCGSGGSGGYGGFGGCGTAGTVRYGAVRCGTVRYGGYGGYGTAGTVGTQKIRLGNFLPNS